MITKELKSPASPAGRYRAIELSRGQLLLEILIAIGAAAAILALGSGLLYVGLSGNKVAVDKDVALGLSEEAFEAVRAIALEKWNGIGADTPIPGRGLYDSDRFTGGTPNAPKNLYPTKESDSADVSYKWISHSPASVTWHDVSALGPNNVWIVGDATQVWNWDGENWLKF